MNEHYSVEALKPKYQRVVLKLSGEGFGHSGKSGISIDETLSIARQANSITISWTGSGRLEEAADVTDAVGPPKAAQSAGFGRYR